MIFICTKTTDVKIYMAVLKGIQVASFHYRPLAPFSQNLVITNDDDDVTWNFGLPNLLYPFP